MPAYRLIIINYAINKIIINYAKFQRKKSRQHFEHISDQINAISRLRHRTKNAVCLLVAILITVEIHNSANFLRIFQIFKKKFLIFNGTLAEKNLAQIF